MKIIKDILTFDELKQIAAELFGNSVKAVVDTYARKLLKSSRKG